jgi:hypothetical protein
MTTKNEKVKLQSVETIEQNGIIFILTGEYVYLGKIENGNTRIFLDEYDGKMYMIDLNQNEIDCLTRI